MSTNRRQQFFIDYGRPDDYSSDDYSSDEDGLDINNEFDPYSPRFVYFVGGTRRNHRATYNIISSECGPLRVLTGTNRELPGYVMVTFYLTEEEKHRHKYDVKFIRDYSNTFDVDVEWYRLVDSFMSYWGKDMVPYDIRWVYNEYVPEFEWPEIVDADNDIIEAVVACMNLRFP